MYNMNISVSNNSGDDDSCMSYLLISMSKSCCQEFCWELSDFDSDVNRGYPRFKDDTLHPV